MVARTAQVMRSGALASGLRYLAVDATGVGRPAVDLLRERQLPCRLWPGGMQDWWKYVSPYNSTVSSSRLAPFSPFNQIS